MFSKQPSHHRCIVRKRLSAGMLVVIALLCEVILFPDIQYENPVDLLQRQSQRLKQRC